VDKTILHPTQSGSNFVIYVSLDNSDCEIYPQFWKLINI